MVSTSFADIEADMCLGYRLIQRDSGPVLLSVNVTADPCPQASWFRRAPGGTVATNITAEASDITVSCVMYMKESDQETPKTIQHNIMQLTQGSHFQR